MQKIRFLVWNQLSERVGDSISQQALKLSVPRHEKRGCKKSSLVWKPTLRESGRFSDVAALTSPVPRGGKREATKYLFFFGNRTHRVGDFFLE
jgi:hypothetical protein